MTACSIRSYSAAAQQNAPDLDAGDRKDGDDAMNEARTMEQDEREAAP